MIRCHRRILTFFFFNDTATTEIYTLSLHDALPIWLATLAHATNNTNTTIAINSRSGAENCCRTLESPRPPGVTRSEEHTSELQSRLHLVCRLLLEKKKNTRSTTIAL